MSLFHACHFHRQTAVQIAGKFFSDMLRPIRLFKPLDGARVHFSTAPNPLFAQPTQCARVSRELVVRVRLELVKPGAPLPRLAVSEASTQQLARRAGREIAPHQKDRSPPTRARRENRGPKSGRRGRASSKSYLPLPSLPPSSRL